MPAADQPESQDLCFLGNRDYRVFLVDFAPKAVNRGLIMDSEGKKLGEHDGLAFYTIGQRKGLPASSQALYVLDKDMANNRLVVGHETKLGKKSMRVSGINWMAGEASAEEFDAEVKIRFKANAAPARVTVVVYGVAQVNFLAPLRDITPGQMAVFYQGDLVLGGGMIG